MSDITGMYDVKIIITNAKGERIEKNCTIPSRAWFLLQQDGAEVVIRHLAQAGLSTEMSIPGWLR